MGSATIANTAPQVPIMPDKKPLKKLLNFFKKDKKKEPPQEKELENKGIPSSAQTVQNILEKIQKLDIRDRDCVENEYNRTEEDELKNFSFKTVDDDDELKNFTFKSVAEVEERVDRSESHSSEDSGFAEKYEFDEQKHNDDEESEDNAGVEAGDEDDDVINGLENLSIGGVKKSKKKSVLIKRAPLRHKSDVCKQTRPYYLPDTDACRQIQINKNTLTGGEVIVNVQKHNDSLEFDNALKQVQETSQYSQHEHGGDWLNIVTEYIQEDSKPESVEDILSEFLQMQDGIQDGCQILTPPHKNEIVENPIEEFSNHVQCYNDLDLTTLNDYVDLTMMQPQFFPTPPHSENASSPMSDTQSYRTSEYIYSPERSNTLSPERASPVYNSDYEKFQDIAHFDTTVEEKPRERKDSLSMTMKQYKDMQKEISLNFSKKECCQLSRKPCKQAFADYLKTLKPEDRKDICLKVAKLDLKHAYGVLQNILISLSQGLEQEAVQYAVFYLVCERVLNQEPAWFVDDFGLNLLKSAALRCHQKPLLTRYLVQCVRTAIRHNASLVQGRESVFHEVDALGDTLVSALARRGDACAGALADLVRPEPGQPPLFRTRHVNADGASALHVACMEHSVTSPRLHCVHVLLEHGGADIWQGDAKAGDTALHMAVNSRGCDLRLIMVLFRHLDRKEWKKLAHVPNKCSTTPLEYARSAIKCQTREYPAEVLEFLKKCR